jgi:hypothetical protein
VYFKLNSLQVSQPGGIGSARIHFELCTDPIPNCEPDQTEGTLQYLRGIAVRPGSTPPQKQAGTSDLRIAAPATTKVFVGGRAPVAFGLSFSSTASTPLAIAYTATSTLKGAKATANAKGQVTVTVPRTAKPGTYEVTLTGTAQVPNGASSSAVAKFKVTKPKIKLGGVKLNKAKGTARLSVKVPSAGTLTVSGKGIVKAKKKTKNAKKLAITIKAKGATKTQLEQTGKAKVKAKVSFKPSSGIAAKKTKSITLKKT